MYWEYIKSIGNTFKSIGNTLRVMYLEIKEKVFYCLIFIKPYFSENKWKDMHKDIWCTGNTGVLKYKRKMQTKTQVSL